LSKRLKRAPAVRRPNNAPTEHVSGIVPSAPFSARENRLCVKLNPRKYLNACCHSAGASSCALSLLGHVCRLKGCRARAIIEPVDGSAVCARGGFLVAPVGLAPGKSRGKWCWWSRGSGMGRVARLESRLQSTGVSVEWQDIDAVVIGRAIGRCYCLGARST